MEISKEEMMELGKEDRIIQLSDVLVNAKILVKDRKGNYGINPDFVTELNTEYDVLHPEDDERTFYKILKDKIPDKAQKEYRALTALVTSVIDLTTEIFEGREKSSGFFYLEA